MQLKNRSVVIAGMCLLIAQVAFGPIIPPGQIDFYSSRRAGVGEIASALGLQIDGQVTGLFAGESLMGVLGPNGAGKTTLLGGHGFAAGDKVRITNVGGGKLKIERLAPDGSVKTYIHTHFQDFYHPDGVEEIATALGLTPTDRTAGLFEGMSMTAIVGPSGSGKSTLISQRGFSAGQKVKVTNAGGGELAIERVGGAPLTIHLQMEEYFRPQGVQVLASALGVQIEGKVTGLFAKQSLNAVMGTGSKLLFDKGYLKGNRVQITNLGSGRLAIERVGGAPLTIHIHMDEYFRPQVVEEIASTLGMQVDGKIAGLFARQSLNARVGGGSKLLFDRGYLKNNRVRVTNAGGGKLTIERLGGAPLSTHIQMDEYWRPEAAKGIASALGVQTVGKTVGLFKGESFEAILAGGGSKMLFDRGYLKGNRVKVTNSGGGKLTVERLSGGAPLTIHIKMDDYY